MRLLLLHPEVAFRDCDICQKFNFEHKTGKQQLYRGLPILRPKGTSPPCRTGVGCAKGTPENQKSLSAKNWKAYVHYQECKATGHFPNDPIVKRNAGIIRQIEDSVREERMLLVLMLRGAK